MVQGAWAMPAEADTILRGGFITNMTVNSGVCSVPSTPTGLNVSGYTKNSVSVRWTDTSSNEQGFHLYYSGTGSSGPWTLSTSVGQNITDATADGLAEATMYWFYVTSYNACGESTMSNVLGEPTGSGHAQP